MGIDFEMITTKGGDEGKSGLFGGERRFKSEAIFQVLGDIDELVSHLGLCKVAMSQENELQHIISVIHIIQKRLQEISAAVSTPVSSFNNVRPLGRNEEKWETVLEEMLRDLELFERDYISLIRVDGFIIPGSCEISARLDVARTVCRRAERCLVSYMREIPATYLRLSQNYLNRLSDVLFVLGRHVEQNILQV